MKPLTKKINSLVESFPFREFAVDESNIKELGERPKKPNEPTLTTKTPTKAEMLVYLNACDLYESDMASYIADLKEYNVRKAKFDGVADSAWGRFVSEVLRTCGQGVSDETMRKKVNELGTKTGLPKAGVKRMEKTLAAFVRFIEESNNPKANKIPRLRDLTWGRVAVNEIIRHDIERDVIKRIINDFRVESYPNVAIPETKENLQYAVDILAATQQNATIEIIRRDNMIHIPIANMLRALELRFT